MERLEEKYDGIAGAVGKLEGAVAVIQHEQESAAQLAKERHGNLEARLTTVSAQLTGFMARIEGLLTGEVQMPQQREALARWEKWRDGTDTRLDAIEKAGDQQAGTWVALRGVKGGIVALAAIVSPVIVLLGILLKP